MQSRNHLRVALPKKLISAFLILFMVLPVLAAFAVSLPQGTTLTPVSSAEASAGDEKIYYFLTDHLGSVDAVLDEQGNVVERRDYLPYGTQRAAETFNGVPVTELGFTGKHRDSETGLNYYGARYYDPVTGRFITMDPLLLNLDKMSQAQRNAFLSNPQNLNMYSYVQNNPVRYTDPTGMYGEDVHYDLTYYLCLQAGLTQGQSKIIAYQDQYVDDNPDTAPNLTNYINNPETIDKYHYQSRAVAKQNLLDAIDSLSSPEVGKALHTYQDTYSHAGLTQNEHIKEWVKRTSPDRTYADVPKALEMAKKSFFFLRLHNLRTNGSGDLSASDYRKQGVEIWNKIEQNVNGYLSLEQKGETQIAKDVKAAREDD